MKKNLVLILALLTFSLSGCSSPAISQESYDAIVAERDSLQEQNAVLVQEKEDIEKKRDELFKKEMERIQEDTNKELESVGAISWATTSFGEDGIYFIDNLNYMQCIAPSKYPATLDSLNEIWQDFVISSATLDKFSEEINHNKIAVKYQGENGATLIEFVLERQGDSYQLNGITVDFEKVNTLVPILSTLGQ